MRVRVGVIIGCNGWGIEFGWNLRRGRGQGDGGRAKGMVGDGKGRGM